MKNKLSDLNDHLFAQLEKLNDDTLTGEQLKDEIKRANAMANISNQIVGAALVTVAAMKLVSAGHIEKDEIPLLLSNK